MVVGVIAREQLQRVEGEAVAAVVVNGLETGHEEEEHGLARRHVRQELRDAGANSVEYESLERVVVERAKCIRDVQPVMHGVELLVEPAVRVHRAVEEVLPCVDNEPARQEISVRESLKE